MADALDPEKAEQLLKISEKLNHSIADQLSKQRELNAVLNESYRLTEEAEKGLANFKKEEAFSQKQVLDSKKAELELYKSVLSIQEKINLEENLISQKRKTDLQELLGVNKGNEEITRRIQREIEAEDAAAAKRKKDRLAEYTADVLKSHLATIDVFMGSYRTMIADPTIRFSSDLAATTTQLQTALRGAGAPGMGAGTGIVSGGGFFGGIPGGVMDPLERMRLLGEVAMQAPPALENTTKEITNMIGTMARFGLQTQDSVKLLIQATRELNLPAAELSEIYRVSASLQKELGLHTSEATKLVLDMSKALRGVGADTDVAVEILSRFSRDITILGQQTTAVEIAEMASRIAGGLGKMPLDRALGLAQFATGTPIQGMSEMQFEKFLDQPFKAAQQIFGRITSQVGGSFGEQSAATMKIAELLGIQASTPKEVLLLREVMTNVHLTEQDMRDKLAALGDPQKIAAQGIKDLTAMVDPIKRIENYTKLMSQVIAGPLAAFANAGIGQFATAAAGTALGIGQLAATGLTAAAAARQLGAIGASGMARTALRATPYGLALLGGGLLIQGVSSLGDWYIDQHNVGTE